MFDRDRSPRVIVLAAAALVAVLALAAGVVLFVSRDTSELPEFYRTPEDIASVEPGTLLREEPMVAATGSATGGTAYRILYRTVGVDGEPVAASGFIAWPSSDPPEGGYPIVALGHSTVGLADECAPSLQGLGTLYRDQITAFIAAGFAVAGPDYPGLGTEGEHPYLAGETTGHSVIDAVRAGRQSGGDLLSDRVVSWGYSQGGHAVLWARALAEQVAPELDWAGTIALAPVVDLAVVVDSTDLGGTLGVAVAMGREAQGLDLEPLLTDAGRATRDDIRDECMGQVIQRAEERGEPLLTDERGWVDDLAGDAPPPDGSGPALVVYGTEDDVVGTDAVREWVRAAAPYRVTGEEVEGIGHGGLTESAEVDVIGWMLVALS